MKKIHDVKHPRPRKGERGFSLIELLIAMAVVLVLVGGLAIAGERSLQASRETSAAQSVQSFSANETTYQRSWGGFSLTAEAMGGAGSTAAAVCTADQEMVIPTGANYETGVVQGGYKFLYTSGTGFAGTGGCTQNVAPTYDITATAVDSKTKNFCADSSGIYYANPGVAITNTGIGCEADNGNALLAVGQ